MTTSVRITTLSHVGSKPEHLCHHIFFDAPGIHVCKLLFPILEPLTSSFVGAAQSRTIDRCIWLPEALSTSALRSRDGDFPLRWSAPGES